MNCAGENREVRVKQKSADKRDGLFLARREKTHFVDEEHLVVNLYAEIVRLDDQVVLVALAVAGKIRIRVLAVIVNFLSSRSGGCNFSSADASSVRGCVPKGGAHLEYIAHGPSALQSRDLGDFGDSTQVHRVHRVFVELVRRLDASFGHMRFPICESSHRRVDPVAVLVCVCVSGSTLLLLSCAVRATRTGHGCVEFVIELRTRTKIVQVVHQLVCQARHLGRLVVERSVCAEEANRATGLACNSKRPHSRSHGQADRGSSDYEMQHCMREPASIRPKFRQA